MAEKIKLEAVAYEQTMTAPTRIQALEADVKIEAKYKGEADFTLVSDTTMMKGEIKQIRDGRVDSISAMIILQRYLAASKST